MQEVFLLQVFLYNGMNEITVSVFFTTLGTTSYKRKVSFPRTKIPIHFQRKRQQNNTKGKHINNSAIGYSEVRMRVGPCCVEVDYFTVLEDKFGPRFQRNLLLANDIGKCVSKTVQWCNSPQHPSSLLCNIKMLVRIRTTPNRLQCSTLHCILLYCA